MKNLIEDMKRPDFYPEGAKAVSIITTHISHIFLTGSYAYKLKRPVNFGFLDFTSTEKRKHFCLEELRLNKRFSADLYIEVLPIFYDPKKGYYLGEGKDPVDWVLKMREFPQSDLFSRLITKKKLTIDILENLGKRLANFHSLAKISEIASFGDKDGYLQVVKQNEGLTRSFVDNFVSTETFEAILQAQREYINEYEQKFKSRQILKKIRECHGDLHLENIVLYQGDGLPFDCIEFNDSFKYIDCLYDAAFLFMDIIHKKRVDLAYSFLNSYLESTGDYEGMSLLKIFCSLRAFIRAKVSSLKYDNCPPEDKKDFEKDAKDFFELSLSFTKKRKGKILAFSGLSGSGKSTLAKKLANFSGAIHIRSDVVRKHIACVPLDEKGTQALYSADMTQKTYDELIARSIELANMGHRIFLDAKFDKTVFRKDLEKKCQDSDINLGWIKCGAPIDVLTERLEKRVGDVSDATASLLNSQIENFEPFDQEQNQFFIDTSTNAIEQLEKARGFWESL